MENFEIECNIYIYLDMLSYMWGDKDGKKVHAHAQTQKEKNWSAKLLKGQKEANSNRKIQ